LQEVYSIILRGIRSTAENYLGSPVFFFWYLNPMQKLLCFVSARKVSTAVISVPSQTSPSRRSAVVAAANNAGFPRVHLINESTGSLPCVSAFVFVFYNFAE